MICYNALFSGNTRQKLLDTRFQATCRQALLRKMAHQAFLRILVAKSQRHVLRLKKERKGIFTGDEKLKVPCRGTGTCGTVLYYLRPLWNMGYRYCKVLMPDIFKRELYLKEKSLRCTFLIFGKKWKMNRKEKKCKCIRLPIWQTTDAHLLNPSLENIG